MFLSAKKFLLNRKEGDFSIINKGQTRERMKT